MHFSNYSNEDEANAINLDNYIQTKIASTSYEEASSLQNYFIENHCTENSSFPYEYQRNAIKRIITTACSKKEGVISVCQEISDASYQIFFAVAQIVFLANEMV